MLGEDFLMRDLAADETASARFRVPQRSADRCGARTAELAVAILGARQWKLPTLTIIASGCAASGRIAQRQHRAGAVSITSSGTVTSLAESTTAPAGLRLWDGREMRMR